MSGIGIHFLLNQKNISLEHCDPNTTVLQLLRDELSLCGTKEGCASGDCGACTVVVGESDGDRMRYRTVNACIALLQGVHGHQLLTIEHLRQDGVLHPTQRSMIDHHGSQCGFCTPGFVMSLFCLHKNHPAPGRLQVEEALSGNLCRCTGYRSIITAGLQQGNRVADQFNAGRETREALRQISTHSPDSFSPTNIADLAALLLQHPQATLLAGGTDLTLEVTQQCKRFETIVYLGNVTQLRDFEVTSSQLRLGAAVTYSQCIEYITRDYPEFGAMIKRLGSLQIRNQGTIGGNIGNASPIGDMPPVLIALGATMTLRCGFEIRNILVEDYFIDYKVTALRQSEFIQQIEIPRPSASHHLKVYKISKRFDDDISTVLAAIWISITDGIVRTVRVAFGGMAAIPKRASRCEAQLLGKPWTQRTIDEAQQALQSDFEPLTDVRGSADYRVTVAKNLLQKCFLEINDPGEKTNVFATDKEQLSTLPDTISEHDAAGGVGTSLVHESAVGHVTGSAVYIDDRPQPTSLLHAAIGRSDIASGLVKSLDLSKVISAEGVVAVITAADVPGKIDIGPVFPGDPVLVTDQVEFYGQAVFAVAAVSHDLARRAVELANVKYHESEPVLDVTQALQHNNFVRPPHQQQRGDATRAIAESQHQLEGEISIGGQEHFYLEGQVSSAQPSEDGEMEIFTSSQHPSEVQKLVAEVLGVSLNQINVEVRRMGGAFGGKETNAAPMACIAALLANKSARPVKLRLGRGDDMVLTGKRHPFENSYRVGFSEQGEIEGIQITLNANCGYSPDLSDAIVDRAMFHSDNAYYLNQSTVIGNRCKTNLVSNTAFRGFGGPQGMLTIESAIEDIARYLGKDPLDIRKLNLYGHGKRNVTHYHQDIEDHNLAEIIQRLELSADYHQRRNEIVSFNAQNKHLKKGMALTPVKFGISFTAKHLNQAGALVHVYSDGSIHLNHGGTEMGQGLFTKVAQIVASEFQVDISTVKVSASRTDKVPNTSPTAASAATDLNGKAAQDAAGKIKMRLKEFASSYFDVPAANVSFADGRVSVGDRVLAFAELAQLAYLNRVHLSATGFYKTPKIHYDRDTGTGRPFLYFATGAAVSEVIIDTLTGEYKVLRTDILHDVGNSINPALDLGQIEGGFVQGLGWMTTEELLWDENGRLLTDSPATYKIPAVTDVPSIFNVELLSGSRNSEETVYHSKAVGEPPLMLAISVWCALRDAVSSVSGYRISPSLPVPATPERVLEAVMCMQLTKKI